MEKTRIGIIGTGNTIGISDQHVMAYHADSRAKITAIYDVDRTRAQARAQYWTMDEAIVCSSLEELFERVDAVSICTPNFTHEELIRAALGAGRHVLCEKPLAHTLESARAAAALSQHHPDLVAMICFNYRDIPAMRYMKERIGSGELGRIFTCRMQMGGNRIANPTDVKLEWRMQQSLSGSGALADFGCHMIDLTNYLLAEREGPIMETQALLRTFIESREVDSGGSRGKVTNDDSAAFTLSLKNGTLAAYLASRIGVPRFTVEIVGEGGMMVFSGEMKEVEVWPKAKDGGYDPKLRETIAVGPEYQGREGHKGVVADFLDAINGGPDPSRSLAVGLAVHEVLDRLERFAADKGGRA
jgi:predicted dehydrogenase